MSEKTVTFTENKIEYVFKILLQGEVGTLNSSTIFTLSIKRASSNIPVLSANMHIIYSPSGNCQTSIIGHLCNIIYVLKSDHILKIGVRNMNNILRTLFSFVKYTIGGNGKTLYIVDYKEHLDKKVSELFKFRTKTPYISTNNSEMILGLIEIKNYK